MVSDLMDDQRTKLVHLIHDKPQVQPDAIAALALIDILEILERVNAISGGQSA